VYPVVHVGSVEQVLHQVRKAMRYPVDGVFLIDHDADDRRTTARRPSAFERSWATAIPG
jgi:hypothetical protein